ncbi:MAG: hypothetical protein JNL72_05680 [Flavipsychrobacter sp.]|nr:hypothetical protein [Flavipsychrobacter sp.]
MVNLNEELAEEEIIKAVKEAAEAFDIDVSVDGECQPGSIIASQVLLSIMARVGRALGVKIPDKCYIFHDKKTKAQLTIKEAVQKLIKEGENG